MFYTRMFFVRALSVSLFVALYTINVRADVDSGPAVGDKLPELKIAVLTSPLEGKEIDQVAERKGKATIYLLVSGERFARPVARFMKTLDGKMKDAGDDAHIVAVWLTDDQDKTKEYLPKVQQSLQLDKTSLAVHPGTKGGPTGWGVNDEAHLTVVVGDGEKVAARWGFVSVNETNVPDVLEAFKKLADAKSAEKKTDK